MRRNALCATQHYSPVYPLSTDRFVCRRALLHSQMEAAETQWESIQAIMSKGQQEKKRA